MAYLDNFQFVVDGVDRTDACEFASAQISGSLNQRTTATFSLIDRTDSYRPGVLEEVEIVLATSPPVAVFAGLVMAVEEERRERAVDATTIRVRCQDYSAYCDRRAVAKSYSLTNGGILSVVVADIVANFLDGTGITYPGGPEPSGVTFEVLFNHVTVTQAFNQISEMTGWQWYINFDKELVWFDPSAGAGAASISLTDTSGTYETLTVSQQSNLYANRVIVRNSSNTKSVWTDSYAGDHLDGKTWPTTYGLPEKPVVKVNGVPQAVASLTEALGGAFFEYYYIDHGIGIFQSTALSPLTGSDLITIEYSSPVSQSVVAEDPALIAADGLVEHIADVKDMDSEEALQAYADGLLAKMKTKPVEIQFTSRAADLRPGLTITANVTTPAVTGTFLIDSVSSKISFRRSGADIEVALLHSCRATTDTPQRPANAVRFFRQLLDRSGNSQSRTASTASGAGGSASNPGAGVVSLWQYDASAASPPVTVFGAGVITGALNGSNDAFQLSKVPDPDAAFFLFLNGVHQVEGVDYSRAGGIVTMADPPVATDLLEARYIYRDAFSPASFADDGNRGYLRYFNNPGIPNDKNNVDRHWMSWGDNADWEMTGSVSVGIRIAPSGDSRPTLAPFLAKYSESGPTTRPFWLSVSQAAGSKDIEYAHGAEGYTFSTQIPPGELTYVGISRDHIAKTVKCYIGRPGLPVELIDTFTYTGSIPAANDEPLIVGGVLYHGGIFPISMWYKGGIDDHYIWKGRALSEAEHNLANRRNPPPNDLVLWCKEITEAPPVNLGSTGGTASLNNTTVEAI